MGLVPLLSVVKYNHMGEVRLASLALFVFLFFGRRGGLGRCSYCLEQTRKNTKSVHLVLFSLVLEPGRGP